MEQFCNLDQTIETYHVKHITKITIETRDINLLKCVFIAHLSRSERFQLCFDHVVRVPGFGTGLLGETLIEDLLFVPTDVHRLLGGENSPLTMNNRTHEANNKNIL